MRLAAVIGFRPQTGRRWLDDGWIGGPEQEPAVIDAGARWLAGAAQTVIFHGPHYFSSWSQPADTIPPASKAKAEAPLDDAIEGHAHSRADRTHHGVPFALRAALLRFRHPCTNELPLVNSTPPQGHFREGTLSGERR